LAFALQLEGFFPEDPITTYFCSVSKWELLSHTAQNLTLA